MNGNIEKGAKIFKTKCSSCHVIEKDGENKGLIKFSKQRYNME